MAIICGSASGVKEMTSTTKTKSFPKHASYVTFC